MWSVCCTSIVQDTERGGLLKLMIKPMNDTSPIQSTATVITYLIICPLFNALF